MELAFCWGETSDNKFGWVLESSHQGLVCRGGRGEGGRRPPSLVWSGKVSLRRTYLNETLKVRRGCAGRAGWGKHWVQSPCGGKASTRRVVSLDEVGEVSSQRALKAMEFFVTVDPWTAWVWTARVHLYLAFFLNTRVLHSPWLVESMDVEPWIQKNRGYEGLAIS